jgi:hypothetical protein
VAPDPSFESADISCQRAAALFDDAAENEAEFLEAVQPAIPVLFSEPARKVVDYGDRYGDRYNVFRFLNPGISALDFAGAQVLRPGAAAEI